MINVVAGIDIGGTNTVIGLVTNNGDCLIESSISTKNHSHFEVFVKSIFQEIEILIKKIGGNHTLIGIGIGAPNGSYNLGAIVDAPNLEWKGILPLSKELLKYTSVPTIVTNDANAAALGEMFFGGARNMKDFIVITLGTGLGSGIVANGKLIVGHDGFAGELGHLTAFPNGRICGCGNKGCLETYASATGIRRTVFMLLADSNQPSILRSVSFEKLTAKMVSDAAIKGDQIALEAFEFTGKILGLKLAETVAMFSPEAIFIFGGLAKAGVLIIEPTKRYMEENLFPIFRNKVKIIPSELEGKNAAVLGAAALIWQNNS
ncbi:MAG: ROK family protein [Bacteroidales bacterium]|nr:ROK family protein [Bacteroidales bacterium]